MIDENTYDQDDLAVTDNVLEDDVVDDVDAESTNEEADETEAGDIEGKPEKPEFLSAGDLYEVILKHKDWRVVEATDEPGTCRPLAQVFAQNKLLFDYDGASHQMKHEGMCEDLIDLYGTEPLDDEAYEQPVLVRELFSESWSDSHRVRKCTADASAKWIKLYPAD